MKWPIGSVCALILASAYAPTGSAACEVTRIEGAWIGAEALTLADFGAPARWRRATLAVGRRGRLRRAKIGDGPARVPEV